MNKRIIGILICAIFLSISLSKLNAQDLGIPKNPITKDEQGNIIDMQSFGPLMMTGDYTVNPVLDNSGKFLHFLITKSTKEEKRAFLQRKKDKFNSLKINDALPQFHIESNSGYNFESQSLDSLASVILFTIGDCPPCEYLDRITDEIKAEYYDINNLIFVKIHFSERIATISYQDSISSFLFAPETADTLKAKFKLVSFPTLIISDVKGRIQHTSYGGHNGSKSIALDAINRGINGIPALDLQNRIPKPLQINPDSEFFLNNDPIDWDRAQRLLRAGFLVNEKINKAGETYYILMPRN